MDRADELKSAAPKDPSAETRETGRFFGPYRVQRTLGRGGMGVVYEAQDTRLNRRVALKAIASGGPDIAPDEVQRFRLEIAHAAKLAHPNIIKVLDVGRERELDYFTMEYVEGQNLSAWLRGGERSFRDRAALMEKVCRALHYAHQQGILHRDLKPSNIMVDSFNEPVVMDFGLARNLLAASGMTLTGQVMGTPAYISPEQARGESKKLAPTADIWSLGASLYEVLTGTPPFTGESVYQILEKVNQFDPLPPRSIDPNIPRDLEAITLKCLHKNAKERYPDARAMAEDIAAHLRGEVISVQAPGVWYHVRRWYKRNRTVAGIAIVATVLLLAVGISYQSARYMDYARRETEALTKVQVLKREMDEKLAAVDRVTAKDAPALVEPNGEPVPSVIQAWYGAHRDAVAALESLLDLDAQAPTPRVHKEIKRLAPESRKRDLTQRAAEKATSLGDYNLARLWISIAELPEAENKQALAKIDDARLQRQKADVDAASAWLLKARDPVRISPEFLDFAIADLLRRRSPDLVRMMLMPEHLDSASESERWLAIEALGKLGDTHTQGPEGLDSVQALSARLKKINLSSDLETAVRLVQALGFLGDARAHDAVTERRWEATSKSLFWARTASAAGRIPLPADMEGGGSREPKTAREFSFRGSDRMEKNNLDGAIQDFTLALEKDSRYVAALDYRGSAYRQKGQYDLALKDHTLALELDNTCVSALRNRALVYRAMNKLDKALEDYEQSLKLDPHNVEAYLGRGGIYFEQNDLDRAIHDFTLALQRDPRSADAHTLRGLSYAKKGEPNQALQDFAQALALDPRQAAALHGRGVLERDSAQNAQAVRDLTEALTLQPRDAGWLVDRGRCYAQFPDYPRALEDFAQALKLEPKNGEALYRKALVLKAMAQPGDAREALRSALEADPQHTDALYQMGMLEREEGHLKDALKCLNTALEKRPKFADALFQRGMVYERQREPAKALSDYQAALELEPARVDVLQQRAHLFALTNKPKEAEADYSMIIRLAPNASAGYAGRGTLRLEKGDSAGALVDFMKFVELEPQNIDAHLGLGMAHFQRGEARETNLELSKVIDKNPKQFQARNSRGLALLTLGEIDAAIEDFARAAEIEPQVPQVRLNLARALCTRSKNYPRTPQNEKARVEDYETAMAQLEKALQLGLDGWDKVQTDAVWDGLRDQARFKKLSEALPK